MSEHNYGPSTKCVHTGTEEDPSWGAIVTPIYQTTTYAVPDVPELIARYLEPEAPVWVQEAARVREKKFGRQLPEDFKERIRQSRFLEYRGFSHEQIRTVMRDDDLVGI